MAENDLESVRKKVEELDIKIVELIDKRAELAKKAGEAKKSEGIEVYDASREAEVMANVAGHAKIMPKEDVKSIYREIISASRGIQASLKIAYFGPKTTFTHMAAIKEFGNAADYIAYDSIAEVFENVEKGNADLGVVPVENSTEGTVNHTLDMFINSNLGIKGEISIPVIHNLLSNSTISDVKKLYSHPQAIAQCRKWISKNLPKVEIIETSSTTKGAESATVYHSSAAIASRLAAEEFGLKIVAENISDLANNFTRFLVIGKGDGNNATGKDKTSIMFSVKHEAGALFNALKPLHDNNVNMTKIESRPTRAKSWEYVFFVDVQGFRDDAKIQKTIAEMQKSCGFIKILGSYPEKATGE